MSAFCNTASALAAIPLARGSLRSRRRSTTCARAACITPALATQVAIAIAARTAGEGPALLFAVSSEGPSFEGRAGTLHAAADAEFREALTRKGGTDFILRDEGMSKIYLPVSASRVGCADTCE